MDVAEIVELFLRLNGFTGLVSRDRECGCELKDLAPCTEGPQKDCEPGYKVDCTKECDHDPGYEPGNWHIQIEKPGS